jgi:hypothetical protein
MNHFKILSLLIFLGSCAVDDSDTINPILLEAGQFPQKWELVSMSGMVANVPPKKEDEMDWQEHYVLRADGTFLKSRNYGKEAIVESGIYEIVQLEDGQYLKLIYSSNNEIIGNCSNDPEEFLRFEKNNTLVGTWWACDGPGLFYKRTQ